MLAAASKALAYVDRHERAILDSDEKRALALVRLLEIARAVRTPRAIATPTIPWRQIAGARDRLNHGHEAVDLDIVWSIVMTDLPALIAEKVLTGES
jgi:uncharacterized protein with HEPN domain